MIRLMSVAVAMVFAGWLVVGSTANASAGPYHHLRHCLPCGPLPTTVHVHISHTNKSYTRYHDRAVYQHVPRYHRIVTITKIQPIVHIYDVTRIHHHKVYYVQDTYAHETMHLPPITYVHPSVINTYDGGCGCHQ